MTDVPLRIKMARSGPVPLYPDECEPHTESPEGWAARREWAEQMSRTHTQRQCKGCGLWAVWEKRTEASVVSGETSTEEGE